MSPPHWTSKAVEEAELEDSKSSQKENLRGRLENAILSLLLGCVWHVRPSYFNGSHSEDVGEEKHQHTCSVNMSELWYANSHAVTGGWSQGQWDLSPGAHLWGF